jgi:hypothetical protein
VKTSGPTTHLFIVYLTNCRSSYWAHKHVWISTPLTPSAHKDEPRPSVLLWCKFSAPPPCIDTSSHRVQWCQQSYLAPSAGKGKVVHLLNYSSTMPWRHMGEWRYSSTIFDLGTRWLASCPGRFTSGEIAPRTHWIEGWVGPRAGLDAVEKRKILPCRELNLGLAIPTKLSRLLLSADRRKSAAEGK